MKYLAYGIIKNDKIVKKYLIGKIGGNVMNNVRFKKALSELMAYTIILSMSTTNLMAQEQYIDSNIQEQARVVVEQEETTTYHHSKLKLLQP